jgi:hypothetical protein
VVLSKALVATGKQESKPRGTLGMIRLMAVLQGLEECEHVIFCMTAICTDLGSCVRLGAGSRSERLASIQQSHSVRGVVKYAGG